MQDPADRVFELLEHAKADCARERNLAVRGWDADKAQHWQGCFDALATAADFIRPLVSERVLQLREPTAETAPDTVNKLAPLAETENFADDGDADGLVDAESYHVLVPCKSLVDSLRRMTKFRKQSARREMMSISFRNGMLAFSMLNVSEGVPAEGIWVNDVLANSSILFNVAKVPPKEDQVVIRVADGNLHIGSSVTPVQLG